MILLHRKKLLFLLIALLTVILGIFATYYLPDRFMFDAYTIILDRYNEKGWLGSYPISMNLYHISGIGKLPFPVVALIQLPVLFYLIWRLGLPDFFHKLYLRNVIMWLALIMLAFFIAFASKEFINFIYIYIICRVLISDRGVLKKIIWSSLLLMLFGAIFRPYYFLIPIISVGIYLINLVSIKNKIFSNIFYGLLIAIFISLSYGLLKGQYMSESSREELNKVRIAKKNTNADTMIISPIKTDSFYGESIGIFYGFLTVNLPINGLQFIYKPQVVAFVIWQLSLVILLLYYYHKILKKKQNRRVEQWIFHLLFAYFIVQGVFEPDLGSAIRHKIGILPLIW
ncbi:MAG: hypothetical protein ABJD23_07360, partial [Nonlabens sp.]